MPETCPVCASVVRVVSSREGTNHYAPLVSATVLRRAKEAVQDLIALREELAASAGMGRTLILEALQHDRSTLHLIEAALDAS